MRSRTETALDLSLYVVTHPARSRGRSHEEMTVAALAGGATVIQLRDKNASTLDLYKAALRMSALCAEAVALFIVNDRLDIALAVGAGVHLGQDDIPADVARRLLGPGKVLGVSVENAEQARKASSDGADYVAIGPIYEARGTKADAGAPVGAAAVTALRPAMGLPIVAIGGIKHQHIAEIITAGAAGAAVVSAIVSAEDVTNATREMKRLIVEARG